MALMPVRRRLAAHAVSGIGIALLVVAACSAPGGGSTGTQAVGASSPRLSGVRSTATPAATETVVPAAEPPSPTPTPAPFQLTSAAFAPNGPIPPEYTCRGADRSPELTWGGVPPGTKALVLFVDDPDGRDWVHWSALDIDPSTTGLPAGVEPNADPPQQGTNDFGRVGYGGPCPPSGTHHYRFTIYALTAPLGLPGHPDGDTVRVALNGVTILGKTTLIGTFAR